MLSISLGMIQRGGIIFQVCQFGQNVKKFWETTLQLSAETTQVTSPHILLQCPLKNQIRYRVCRQSTEYSQSTSLHAQFPKRLQPFQANIYETPSPCSKSSSPLDQLLPDSVHFFFSWEKNSKKILLCCSHPSPPPHFFFLNSMLFYYTSCMLKEKILFFCTVLRQRIVHIYV